MQLCALKKHHPSAGRGFATPTLRLYQAHHIEVVLMQTCGRGYKPRPAQGSTHENYYFFMRRPWDIPDPELAFIGICQRLICGFVLLLWQVILW